MALRFVAISAETGNDHSPTIWLDDTNGDLIIQSYIADPATVQEAQRVGSTPGHSTDVPPHETMIRLPANMVPFIPRPDETQSA